MIEYVGALLTWLDVARKIAGTDYSKAKRAGVLDVDVTWEELLVNVDNQDNVDAALAWLEEIFPGRVKRNPLELSLDGLTDKSVLPIEVEQKTSREFFRQSFGEIDGRISFQAKGAQQNVYRKLPVVATLSVKGGTGRTTIATAFALEWAKVAKRPILLADADLEAPGISYLYQEVNGDPHIALEDVVALIHQSPAQDVSTIISWVADRLRDQNMAGNLFVLPLRRDLSDLSSSGLKPENLINAGNPFRIADIAAEIAEKLDCAGVIFDVRAGLVPIGANLALDPSVSQLIITTLSSQSLKATASLLRYIGRESARSGLLIRRPLIFVNRVPALFRQNGIDRMLIAPVLQEATAAFVSDSPRTLSSQQGVYDDSVDLDPFTVVTIPEIADLQVGASRWNDFVSQISESGFLNGIAPEVDSFIRGELIEADFPSDSKPEATTNEIAVSDRRKLLRSFSEQLIAAENVEGEISKPLVTEPISALAHRFISEVPIAISEGAKGTGKTLAARYLIDQQTWRAAVEALIGVSGAVDSIIVPICASIQSSESVLKQVDNARKSASVKLGLAEPMNADRSTSYLRSLVSSVRSDEMLLSSWLDIAAWSCGFNVDEVGAGEKFIGFLMESKKSVVLLFEGLEELIQDNLGEEEAHAMRILLVNLPQRLRSELHRPVGLLAFVRRDTVDLAIKQNRDQFRRSYSSYALTWTEDDILELAAWLATQSGAIPKLWSEAFKSEFDSSQKTERLRALWGLKLGPDDRPGQRTREAYTATWIIAVLSDLQGRLVPRDLVRFLANAAAITVDSEDAFEYAGRMLVPRALKAAVEPTSEKKVLETEEEIAELKTIFAKFRSFAEQFNAPIMQSSLEQMDISKSEVDTLRRHGIVFGEAPPYEVPELFRRGLNLRHTGARRSVVDMYRRARRRNP